MSLLARIFGQKEVAVEPAAPQITDEQRLAQIDAALPALISKIDADRKTYGRLLNQNLRVPLVCRQHDGRLSTITGERTPDDAELTQAGRVLAADLAEKDALLSERAELRFKLGLSC